jgi:uncharacterized protein YraI
MQSKNKKNFSIGLMLGLILLLVLNACGGNEPPPTQDVSMIQTQSAETVVAEMTQNAPQAPVEATLAPPPGPAPDPNIPVGVIPTPAPGEPAAIANYNTIIYSGPGTNYVVYSTFLGSQTALVTGKSEDGLWWAISVPVAPGGNGWVSGGWVTVSNADAVPVLPTPPVPPSVNMVPPGPDEPQATAIANVFVRTGPGSNFPAYGIAQVGASGRVIGKSEDGQWWVVRLNPENIGAGYGWVLSQYTRASNVDNVQTIASPSAQESAPPPPPPAGVPSATALEPINVRSGPGTNFLVYVVAPAGASGEVVGKSADSGWWQVKISTKYTPDGLGWVSGAFVTTQNTGNIPVVDAPPAPPVVGPTPPPGGAYQCLLVAQNPIDGTVYTAGTSFSTTWVLQNISAEKWDAAEYDLAYVGAVANIPLHQGSDRYDMTITVEPNGTYNFTVPMIAPFTPGVYGELWQIVKGNQSVCDFYVYIEVK